MHWRAWLQIETRGVLDLMNNGLFFSDLNFHLGSGYVGFTQDSGENFWNSCEHWRHYYLTDTGPEGAKKNDWKWKGWLVMYAKRADTLAEFPVQDLSPDLVHQACAWNEHGELADQYASTSLS